MKYTAIFLSVFIILSACTASFAAIEAVRQAWGYYLNGDYQKAIDGLHESAQAKNIGEEGYYLMGLCFLKLNDGVEAWNNFNYALENYPYSPIRQNILLGLADSYFIAGQYDDAAACYEKLIKQFPAAECLSMAYLRMGISLDRQGRWREAEDAFSSLARYFPKSMETAEAKKYLNRGPAIIPAHVKTPAAVHPQVQVPEPARVIVIKQGDYSVQVGAFSRDLNAYTFAETLKNGGYDAFIEKKTQDGELLYTVKIGRFQTKEDAQSYADKLAARGLTARVVS